MLTIISVLTCLVFAVTYPLYFWVNHDDPLKNKFHRFHIGLAGFLAGVLAVGVWGMDVPEFLRVLTAVWAILLLVVTAFSWNKEFLSPGLVSVPCMLGAWLFIKMAEILAGLGIEAGLTGILGGFILSGVIFAMNLGHWYLNVPGLPIRHLQRIVKILGILLCARIVWDGYYLASRKLLYFGEYRPGYEFLFSMEGVFLWIALFFGTLFPLVALFFVNGTLKVKSTQSATGILYVIVTSVLLGELTYRYYWIKYGMAL